MVVTGDSIRGRQSGMFWTAGACAAASALLSAAGPKVLFVGSTVVPVWTLTGAMLAVGLALLVASRAGGSRAARVTVTSTFAVAGLLFGLGALFTGVYHVISPIGLDGCRVVVKEWSFGQGSGGDVWEARGLRLGRHIGGYSGDDWYRPVHEGTYSLTWDGGVGVFTVWGTEPNPVWRDGPASMRDEPFRVECAG